MAEDLTKKSPLYNLYLDQWQKCRDVWDGERAVKDRDCGHRYLPPTSGMLLDANVDEKAYPWGNTRLPAFTKGYADYKNYLTRAVLHQFYGECVDTMMGLLWEKAPPEIKLPPRMKYLEKAATPQRESLLQLWKGINQTQLSVGWLGLLPDFGDYTATRAAPDPYICTYSAESIINWRSGFAGTQNHGNLTMVVMNESGPDIKPGTLFEWTTMQQYRVLLLQDNKYMVGVFKQEDAASPPPFDMGLMTAPNAQGKTLDFIPFTFVSSCGTTPEVVPPPLLDLADLSLGIYRLEADYRFALFKQTLATFFTAGFNWNENSRGKLRVGGHIHASNPQAKAEWVELQGKGIPELRAALENEKKLAAYRSGQVIDNASKQKESGEALKIKVGVRTVTLKEVALAGAEALEKQLNAIATWLGLDPTIEVKPNLEFTAKEFDAAAYASLIESKMMKKAPMALESIHAWVVEHGGPGKDLTWDQVKELLKQEQELMEELAPTPPNAIEVEEAKAKLNPKSEPGKGPSK